MLFDAHLHSFNVGHADLEAMYLSDVRSFVSAVVFPRACPVSPEIYRALWDFQVEDEVVRARDYLLDAYAMIGVAMVSVPTDPEPLLAVLEQYLAKERVVAVGEIGIEPNSPTCRDLGKQKDLYVSQVEIARKAGAPVVVHTPNKPELKAKYTAETLQLARDAGFDLGRLVIDHCSEVNIKEALGAGAKAAITIQSWRGMTPETAADLIEQFGSERIWVNSDSSDLPSDPLAVARLAYVLRKRGFDAAGVDNVCRKNAAEFYGLEL
jgi:hypothetical protein